MRTEFKRSEHNADLVQMVLEPCAYIDSLPSKGVRNSAIDGLETWYQVPEKSLATIRDIVSMLHNASLMSVHPQSKTQRCDLIKSYTGWMMSKIVLR